MRDILVLLLSAWLLLLFIAGGCSLLQPGVGGPAAGVAGTPTGTPVVGQSPVEGTLGHLFERSALVALPAILGGIALVMLGQMKSGIWLAGGGLGLLAVMAALVKYATYITYGGLFLIVAGCVWLVVSKAKLLKQYQGAFGEVVEGVQRVKKLVFNHAGATNELVNITLAGTQSDETQKLVQDVKTEKGL